MKRGIRSLGTLVRHDALWEEEDQSGKRKVEEELKGGVRGCSGEFYDDSIHPYSLLRHPTPPPAHRDGNGPARPSTLVESLMTVQRIRNPGRIFVKKSNDSGKGIVR